MRQLHVRILGAHARHDVAPQLHHFEQVAQRALVEDDLRSGRLVAPFALNVKTSGAYYLAYHPDRPKSTRLVAFVVWLVREAEGVGKG